MVGPRTAECAIPPTRLGTQWLRKAECSVVVDLWDCEIAGPPGVRVQVSACFAWGRALGLRGRRSFALQGLRGPGA
eukprot:4395392-Alexandrium_andersonii.AAC.1